ncbi:MAG: hypothetical protein G01um101430_423 [Parcubacteria group bacterium Gr01-1014_30]|nr:MAG: hypothetical protein G01um101430_423 [Parcubacteria group bacterium Gr01-1014_30]
MVQKKYRAIFLPDYEDKKHYTKDGFSSIAKAEKYIIENFCDACKQYYNNPKEAGCFHEWDIEEYEEKQ